MSCPEVSHYAAMRGRVIHLLVVTVDQKARSTVTVVAYRSKDSNDGSLTGISGDPSFDEIETLRDRSDVWDRLFVWVVQTLADTGIETSRLYELI